MNDNNINNKFINAQNEDTTDHNVFINVAENGEENQKVENAASDFVTISYDNVDSATTNPDIIFCAKCGSEMKKNARYCMKCGNLNYDHPDNEHMKKIAMKSFTNGEFISGVSLDGTMKNQSSGISSTKICLIVNLCLYFLPLIAFIILLIPTFSSDVSLSLLTCFGYAVICAVCFLYSYSIQLIFIKSGEPWWGYYIPFYNNYLLYKVTLDNGWLFLTLCVPILGSIISILMLYNLGTRFYKSGLLTIFFPWIMIPIIAFSGNTEYSILAKSDSFSIKKANSSALDSKGRTISEVNYKKKKLIITMIILAIVGLVLYFCWEYIMWFIRLVYSFFMEILDYYK